VGAKSVQLSENVARAELADRNKEKYAGMVKVPPLRDQSFRTRRKLDQLSLSILGAFKLKSGKMGVLTRHPATCKQARLQQMV
jgi:hypothetical protein